MSKDKHSPNSYFFGAIKKTEDGERIYYGNSLEWGKRYYHHDHLGSISGLIDGQGNYLASYEYWPYGEEMTSSTYNEDSYRYTGQERDYDLSMDYMKSRHYKYEKGRFHQPDPVNGSIDNAMSWNLYTYVNNNPLKFTDPFGLREKGEGQATVETQNEKKTPKEKCEEDGGRYENRLCIFGNKKARVYDIKEFEKYSRESILRDYAKALENGFIGSVNEFLDYASRHTSVTVTPPSIGVKYTEIPLNEGSEVSGIVNNLFTLGAINLSIGAQLAKGQQKYDVGVCFPGKGALLSIGIYSTFPKYSDPDINMTGIGISITFGTISLSDPPIAYFLLTGPY